MLQSTNDILVMKGFAITEMLRILGANINCFLPYPTEGREGFLRALHYLWCQRAGSQFFSLQYFVVLPSVQRAFLYTRSTLQDIQ